MSQPRLVVRAEVPADAQAIAALITSAFAGHPHSNGSEAAIVERLRAAGALTLALVSTISKARCVGHIAFSPVRIGALDLGWVGLGPLSVAPDHQRQGIGSALAHEGLRQVRSLGARGCVVLGEPDYYRRFGFIARASLVLAGVPADHFLALSFDGTWPSGAVTYATAFDAPG